MLYGSTLCNLNIYFIPYTISARCDRSFMVFPSSGFAICPPVSISFASFYPLWNSLFFSLSHSLSKASFLSRLLAAIRFAWRFSHDPNELVVANYSNCWLLGGTNLLQNQVPLVSAVILFDLSVVFVSARVLATRRRKRSRRRRSCRSWKTRSSHNECTRKIRGFKQSALCSRL